jgi:hypothetical protein
LPVVLAVPPIPPPQAPTPPAATSPPGPPATAALPVPVAPAAPTAQQVANIGQIIGGPGQLAGNVATLAAGGPPGALVAAAQAIYDQVSRALTATVTSIGESLQRLAALDPRAFLDGLNALVERVPLVGSALAEVNRQFAGFVNALDQTASRLAAYSSELAVAQAQTEVAQTLGDVRRAQVLGSGLARFTEAQNNLSQAAQDALTELLRPLLPIATNILNGLTELIRVIPNIPADVFNFFVPALNALVDALNNVAQKITFGTAAIIPHVRAIRQNTDPRPDLPAAPFLDELLGFNLPAGGAAPPRAPGFVGG